MLTYTVSATDDDGTPLSDTETVTVTLDSITASDPGISIDAANEQMAWGAPNVNSWYKNAKGHVTQNWPFTLLEFWTQTLAPDPETEQLARRLCEGAATDAERGRVDLTGGAGADNIQYAVNAPVNIDGGDGFDTVIIIGTEFNDDFVVTENGVYGAGLNVLFTRVESVEVDGAEGDDRVAADHRAGQDAGRGA